MNPHISDELLDYARHEPDLAVLGVSSIDQLDECLGALDLILDDESRHRLDNA